MFLESLTPKKKKVVLLILMAGSLLLLALYHQKPQIFFEKKQNLLNLSVPCIFFLSTRQRIQRQKRQFKTYGPDDSKFDIFHEIWRYFWKTIITIYWTEKWEINQICDHKQKKGLEILKAQGCLHCVLTNLTTDFT